MQPDDKICYCYNVPLRKLWHYARRENLQRPSQMSNCLGAGTGCGWCIPFLQRIFDAARRGDDDLVRIDTTPEQYAEQRRRYIDDKQPRNKF